MPSRKRTTRCGVHRRTVRRRTTRRGPKKQQIIITPNGQRLLVTPVSPAERRRVLAQMKASAEMTNFARGTGPPPKKILEGALETMFANVKYPRMFA